MGKISRLARSALARIFSQRLVFCPILSFIAPYHIIRKYRPICFWDARSLCSLVHISYMWFFLCRYIWGASPPPPPYQELATLLLPAFAHQKSGQMKLLPSPPPPLATWNRRQVCTHLWSNDSNDSTLYSHVTPSDRVLEIYIYMQYCNFWNIFTH